MHPLNPFYPGGEYGNSGGAHVFIRNPTSRIAATHHSRLYAFSSAAG